MHFKAKEFKNFLKGWGADGGEILPGPLGRSAWLGDHVKRALARRARPWAAALEKGGDDGETTV